MTLPVSIAARLYWAAEATRGWDVVASRHRELVENQWRSPEEIADLQLKKLQQMLVWAYETVPYYRALMQHRGLTGRSFTHPDMLRRLPKLTRPILRSSQDALRSTAIASDHIHDNFSSGSTGLRAAFKQDVDHKLWARAHQLRAYGWCEGWTVGEPFALIWGNPVYWQKANLHRRVVNALSNRVELNAFRLGAAEIADMLARLVRLRPRLISGYSTALYLIARLARDTATRIPELRAVQPTAEPLTEEMRQTLMDGFGCPVFDKYGSRETNIVAHESPAHAGMCIQSENVFVEFLRPDDTPCAPGETGTLVFTTLNNLAMPLIRYQSSDLAAPLPGRCPSGRGLPLMTPVRGRQQDVLSTPDGEVHPQVFSNIFMRFVEIEWFQVVQERMDTLHVRVVAPSGLSDAVREEIRALVTQHTGYPFRLEFELLSEMPPSVTGKFRLCENRIERPTP